MSESIRRALESHLAGMTPALDPTDEDRGIAYENKKFTPKNGVPYQEARMIPATPDNASQGTKHYIEVGIFQVLLKYPNGGGSATAQARAEAIRTWFKRGTTVTHGSINTIVTRTPAKAQAIVEGDRYVIPISIQYQADIFT